VRQLEKDWISSFLEYTEDLESPEEFFLWSGLTTLSIVMEKNVWKDRGRFKVYPNLYTILIGPAGWVKKNQAIKMGLDLLDDIDNPPLILAQQSTPEAIISEMSNGVKQQEGKIKFVSAGVVHAPELSSFLGKKSTNKDLIIFLTDIFDFNKDIWSKGTQSRGREELYNPCLNLIAGSTPEWLKECIGSSSVAGGFLGRTNFVYSENPKRPIAHPEDYVTEKIEDLRRKLIFDLNEISKLEGTFSWSQETKNWYKSWYEKEFESLKNDPLASLFSRRHVMMIKLGMIISASEGDSKEITIPHLEKSKLCLDRLKEGAPQAVELITTEPSGEDTIKVLNILRKCKRLTRSQLTRKTTYFIKAEELAKVIDTLEQAEFIRSSTTPKGGTIYTLN